MLNPKTNNCVECNKIENLLSKIDCNISEFGKTLHNNLTLMLNKYFPSEGMNDLLHYKRILTYKYNNVDYASDYSIDKIINRISKFFIKDCKCIGGSGTPSATTSLKIWYGAVENIPTNSEEVNQIFNYIYNNIRIINLQTGVVFKKFVVVIPANEVSDDFLIATDVSNFNAQLTYNKVDEFLVETEIGPKVYKVFSLEIGNPYPLSATHIFNLT